MIIAGIDPLGYSGISRDIETLLYYGVRPGIAPTCRTIQNSRTVTRVLPHPAREIESEISFIMNEMRPRAVKIGLVPDPRAVVAISRTLSNCHIPIVLDPVMRASNGCQLASASSITRQVKLLFPIVHVITPNIPEAERLAGMRIRDVRDMFRAAEKLLKLGPKYIIIKGGHLADGSTVADGSTDILVCADGFHAELASSEIRRGHVRQEIRGSGCSFSSALAAEIALDRGIFEATCGAKRYVRRLLIELRAQT